eukprot:scaffold13_cov377-Prasinococcus_capsulatus_cf.AAC.18
MDRIVGSYGPLRRGLAPKRPPFRPQPCLAPHGVLGRRCGGRSHKMLLMMSPLALLPLLLLAVLVVMVVTTTTRPQKGAGHALPLHPSIHARARPVAAAAAAARGLGFFTSSRSACVGASRGGLAPVPRINAPLRALPQSSAIAATAAAAAASALQTTAQHHRQVLPL